jgi:DNA processing protein
MNADSPAPSRDDHKSPEPNQIRQIPSPADLSERDAALCLHLAAGLGPKTFQKLVEHFGSAVAVVSAPPSRLQVVPGVSPKLARNIALCLTETSVQDQLQLCQAHQIAIHDPTSEFYPSPLKKIYDPPSILFSQGRLTEQDQIAIAIVGSRHATHYGLRTAEKLASQLAIMGFTVVSGLARGIDAAAHRGALKVGGRTIAVLGGGLLNIYPPEHIELARQIRDQGVLCSESLPKSAPKSGSFPSRNRIITGLSLGVVVVEASERSGALISARLASEQGREVFAVPGQIDSRLSRGCHRLIRDGAKLIESVDDILEELGPLAVPARLSSKETVRRPVELMLGDQEKAVLNAISTSVTSFDSLVATTGLPTPRILSTVSVLEIRGLIKRISGTNFVRV